MGEYMTKQEEINQLCKMFNSLSEALTLDRTNKKLQNNVDELRMHIHRMRLNLTPETLSTKQLEEINSRILKIVK